MLSLTKKSEYALIALCHLAHAEQEVVSARDIAGRFSVRLPLLMSVLKTLNQHGLLRSVRGARGGYKLACDPGAITLRRLIEAVEGPVRLVKCAPPFMQGDECCELTDSCPVRSPLHRVHEYLGEFLTSVTVADLAFDEGYGSRGRAGTLKVLAE